MRNKKTLFYGILSVLIISFSGKLSASTVQESDVGQFTADNNDAGVKNTKSFNVSIDQDSLLGVIVDTNTLLKFNDSNAADLELAGGPRVFRANSTYGYALNDKNRIKITGEYLTEALDFNFYSGDTRQWVNQGAVGAAYQYWLGGSTFKNVQIGSYYSHAPSKQLSDKTIVLNNSLSLLDQRQIAGGNDIHNTAETAMSLWSHSLLTVGVDYDQVHYNTDYNIHSDSNMQGLGGHAQLQQLLTPSTELNLQSSISPLFSNYGAALNWIWTSKKNTALSAGIDSTYTADYTTNRRFWVNGISLNVVWDAARNDNKPVRYSDPDVAAQDLSTWSSQPAVRMPDVLTISDERITQINTPNTPNAPNLPDEPDTRRLPSKDDFAVDSAVCPAQPKYDPNTQTYSAAGGWVQSYPKGPAANTIQPIFQSADLMRDKVGAVKCEYKVSVQKTILLSNPAYTHVKAQGSNWQAGQDPYWPSAERSPAQTCGLGAPSTQCRFATIGLKNSSKNGAIQSIKNSPAAAVVSSKIKAAYQNT